MELFFFRKKGEIAEGIEDVQALSHSPGHHCKISPTGII
jgi:hypothetical protein